MSGRRQRTIERAGLRPNMRDDAFDRLSRITSAALRVPTVLFSVVDDDRQFFPSSIGLSEPWAAAGETPLTHSFCKHVVADDAPLSISDAHSDQRVADSRAQDELGVGAYLGVPVRDDQGNVLGALCAIEPSAREWTETDLDLLTDAAKAVEAELDLRRSRDALTERLDVENLAARYEKAVSSLASAATREATVQGVVDELARSIGPAIGAAVTSIAIVESGMLSFTHGRGVDDDIAAEWEHAPIDADIPMAAAIVSGRTVHLPDPSSFDRHRDFADAAERLGLQSFRAVPFGDEAAELFGVIGVGWLSPMPPELVPRVLDRVVELAGATLTRAWRFEIEREQARVLERVVLPTALPDAGLYELTARYVAPEFGRRVGGDVYDVVVRDDGAVGVLVADAVGHDLVATRAAARMRHAVGVLLSQGYRPAEVLGAVNDYVAASPSKRLVTCVCLLFAADGSSVTIASAGHPPPILRSGSSVDFVGPVGDPLLGRGRVTYREALVALQPGDLVLAYTDGLIDRRGSSVIEAEQALLDFVREQPEVNPHVVADRLIETVDGAEASDDVAFLLVGQPESPEGRMFRWNGPAGELSLADVRQRLTSWLKDCAPGHPPDIALLVAVELLTNAREASDAGSEIGVSARRIDTQPASPTGAAIELVVSNPADPFDISLDPPSSDAARGRGLSIVRHLSEDFTIQNTDGVVLVRALVELSA